MKKKLIFIQLCIVLILFCINVKGQNASLNKALEISYYNFLRTVPDRWKDKFDRKDFYLVNNYNPYGFNVQRIKGWNNLHLKNGKLIIGKNLVGYPLLQMIGRDTLLIEIGQIFCRQDKMWAFTDGYTSLLNYYIIGWPILFIKKGNIIVRLHCSYKSGIRKKIISEVQYTFDEKKNKWTLHNENSTTMSIKMK